MVLVLVLIFMRSDVVKLGSSALKMVGLMDDSEGGRGKSLFGKKINFNNWDPESRRRFIQTALDETPIPVAFSGKVLNESGRTPIVGAHVRIQALSSQLESIEKTTGNDGGFRIDAPAAYRYELHVDADGFSSYKNDSLVITRPNYTMDILLTQKLVVKGRVVDQQSQGIPNAMVGFYSDRGDGLHNPIASDAKGAFSISSASFMMMGRGSGSVQINATHAGYDSIAAVAVKIPVEEEVIIRMKPASATGSIVGLVRDSGLAPIPGAKVTISDPGSQQTLSETVTDQKGEYRLAPVRAGSFPIRCTADGYLQANNNQSAIRISSGREARLDFNLKAGQQITGVVVNKNGEPVANATVMYRAMTASRGGNNNRRSGSSTGQRGDGTPGSRGGSSSGRSGFGSRGGSMGDTTGFGSRGGMMGGGMPGSGSSGGMMGGMMGGGMPGSGSSGGMMGGMMGGGMPGSGSSGGMMGGMMGGGMPGSGSSGGMMGGSRGGGMSGFGTPGGSSGNSSSSGPQSVVIGGGSSSGSSSGGRGGRSGSGSRGGSSGGMMGGMMGGGMPGSGSSGGMMGGMMGGGMLGSGSSGGMMGGGSSGGSRGGNMADSGSQPVSGSTTTDAKGRFQIIGLTTDPYQIDVQHRDYVELITQLQPSSQQQTLVLDGALSLRGKAINGQGVPFDQFSLMLQSEASSRMFSKSYSFTSSDGRFEVRGLTPDKYTIVLRAGSRSGSTGDMPGFGSRGGSTADMSGFGSRGGGMPGMPGSGSSGGGMPGMPGSGSSGGGMPGMPGSGSSGGGMPGMPGFGSSGSGMPGMPGFGSSGGSGGTSASGPQSIVIGGSGSSGSSGGSTGGRSGYSSRGGGMMGGGMPGGGSSGGMMGGMQGFGSSGGSGGTSASGPQSIVIGGSSSSGSSGGGMMGGVSGYGSRGDGMMGGMSGFGSGGGSTGGMMGGSRGSGMMGGGMPGGSSGGGMMGGSRGGSSTDAAGSGSRGGGMSGFGSRGGNPGDTPGSGSRGGGMGRMPGFGGSYTGSLELQTSMQVLLMATDASESGNEAKAESPPPPNSPGGRRPGRSGEGTLKIITANSN
jgi:uncharacterized GH25 family protein